MNDMSADNIIKVLNKTVSVKESRFFSNIFSERKIFQDILVHKYSRQYKLWWSALYLSNDIMTLDRKLPHFEKRCRIQEDERVFMERMQKNIGVLSKEEIVKR